MAPKKSKAAAARKKAAARARSKAKSASKTNPVRKPDEVAAYFERISEPSRKTFDKLRAIVRSAAPRQAIEIISYRIPALRHDGMTVWYAAFRKHCSLFPGSSLIEAHADELEEYEISKGTIQFPIDRPLPVEVVKKIVRARFKQVRKK